MVLFKIKYFKFTCLGIFLLVQALVYILFSVFFELKFWTPPLQEILNALIYLKPDFTYIKQALVVQRLDSTIKWINPYPVDKLSQNINLWIAVYPVDSIIQSSTNHGVVFFPNLSHPTTIMILFKQST